MIKRGDWVWACIGRKTSRLKVVGFHFNDKYVILRLPGLDVVAFKRIDEVWKAKPPLIAIIRTWLQCGFANK